MSLPEEKMESVQSSKQQLGVDQSHKYKWIGSIMNAASTSTAQSDPAKKPRIQKISPILQNLKHFEKCYVPRVVSLGPYHHGNPKFKFIEDLKPTITNKFVEGDQKLLEALYDKLYNKIKDVRNCYEEYSTDSIPDDKFTSMMLQDGCFILYYINHAVGEISEDLELKTHQIAFIQQDMFLLENQIPYIVLEELMRLRKDFWESAITWFINSIMVPERVPKGRCNTIPFSSCCKTGSGQGSCVSSNKKEVNAAHLLSLLQERLIGEHPPSTPETTKGYTFRNVNELLTVGIHFRPSKSNSLADIHYRPSGYFAYLELPPITIDDSTRPLLLNLVAYEMSENVPNESWVTSYICFLDSLIDHAEDVKELRKAGVLDNSLGSDEEVAKLFNEIGTDLVPNPTAYADAKGKIQKHYENKGKTWIAQLEHEYFKNPWSFIALLGAVVALFLSGVQTYFSVWSKSECDTLCKTLKQNHHL